MSKYVKFQLITFDLIRELLLISRKQFGTIEIRDSNKSELVNNVQKEVIKESKK